MPNYRNQSTGNIAAEGESVGLEWREFFNGGVGVQVTGTWTGTLQVQVTLDGTNYSAVLLRLTTTEGPISGLTANGIAYADVIGARNVRVIATAEMTGTAVITLVGLPG
jgi:hypothetical protein